MSVPEYYQKAEDHQSILLLVRQLNGDQQLLPTESHSEPHSEATTQTNHSNKLDGLFDLLHNELASVQVTKINGNLSYERTIRLRFKKNNYEPSNNDWGDFQAHRKLYGLITIGILGELNAPSDRSTDNSNGKELASKESQDEGRSNEIKVDEIKIEGIKVESEESKSDEIKVEERKVDEFYEKHKSFANTYSTLLDSRCLLLKVVHKQPNSNLNSNCESIVETKSEEEENGQGDSTGEYRSKII